MTDSQGKRKAIILHGRDNVATALKNLTQGETVLFPEQGMSIRLLHDIGLGHKFALTTIASGEKIYKYGVPIGRATADIATGAHVHLHNLETLMKDGGM